MHKTSNKIFPYMELNHNVKEDRQQQNTEFVVCSPKFSYLCLSFGV